MSYPLYVGRATLAEGNFGDVFRSSLTSPWGIAAQVAMLGAIVFLARVDWARRLGASDG